MIPKNAKVLGTVFEGGMLVRDKLQGRNPYIAVFIELGFAEEDVDGRISFDTQDAKGKRTAYLRSLVHHANHWELWDSYASLVDRMEQRGLMMKA